jgi:CRISPR/Cas system endoribonuclease Cas6 (RAMP superfamily)
VKIGAVGHVTYTDLGSDLAMRSALRLLADFASFAGVGAHTTVGMGQCFVEE